MGCQPIQPASLGHTHQPGLLKAVLPIDRPERMLQLGVEV
jgi:hypothetical protein